MIARVWLQTCMFSASLLVPAVVAQELPRVMIQTDLGSMEVEVDTIKTPDAARSFLSHVDQGAFQGGRFYRTVRAERLPGGRAAMQGIEGGLNPSRSTDGPPMAVNGKKDTGLALGDKALSLGRDRLDAGTPDFFIRVGAQPELGRLDPDGQGFTPFGRVVRGSAVVRLIQTARAEQQRLTPPIAITNITRVK
jgi:peptidyl-prolyl cis-trans isomerase A (cyclophilin A)